MRIINPVPFQSEPNHKAYDVIHLLSGFHSLEVYSGATKEEKRTCNEGGAG